MEKIKNISLTFKIILEILFVALPLFLILAWMNSPESLTMLDGIINMSFIPQSYVGKVLHKLSVEEKLLGFGVSIVPLLVDLYILYALIKLFNLYSKGIIFSILNVNYIRKIGYALLITQLIEPLYEFSMGFILTAHNPIGHRMATITFGQNNLGMIFIALIVILVSEVMREGCKLREEQQLTI